MSKGGWQKGKVTGEGEILTHEQTLKILSEMAKNGSVTATVALARGLRLDPGEEGRNWMSNSSGSWVAMTERRRRSVYEDRGLGWRDRLRRLVGREQPPAPLCEPARLVTEQGCPVGYRCENGSVLRFPEPPSDPRQWPESAWGDDPDDDIEFVIRRDRRSYRRALTDSTLPRIREAL